MKLRRLAHAVVLAWGWHRTLIAFGAGLFSVLALPPINAWPVLFLTFPLLVWIIDGAGEDAFGGIGSAALAGWCCAEDQRGGSADGAAGGVDSAVTGPRWGARPADRWRHAPNSGDRHRWQIEHHSRSSAMSCGRP